VQLKVKNINGAAMKCEHGLAGEKNAGQDVSSAVFCQMISVNNRYGLAFAKSSLPSLAANFRVSQRSNHRRHSTPF